MKKIAAVIVVIAIGGGLFFVFKSRHSSPENASEKPVGSLAFTSNNSPPAVIQPGNATGVPPALSTGAMSITGGPSALATAPKAATMPVSALPPLTVLDNARVAMKNYGTMFGENPVGTNQEITEALKGKNPKQVNFITEESGLRVNENGEMVDAWGTPFFFHQISGKEMEIHSAGEDRKMWTFDDLVTR